MAYVCEGCGNRNSFYASSSVSLDNEGSIIDSSSDYDEVYCSGCGNDATWMEGSELESFYRENPDPEEKRKPIKVDIDKKLTGDEQ